VSGASAYGRVRPGLVSISFRALPPEEIVRAAAVAGLEGIEWGGDVHAPHGDIGAARRVRRLCADAGLAVAAYGSYLRFAAGDPAPDAVLDTAEALGTSLVRVWAGKLGSADADAAHRAALVDGLRAFTAAAAARGISAALEFHGGTLTDTAASTLDLLDAVPGLLTLWQPPNGTGFAERAESLRAVLSRLANLHVFHWGRGFDDRYPLAVGAADWERYFQIAGSAPAGDRWALLEFMPDNDIRSLSVEAAVLREILAHS
jgi:sugar phosphate isomerase/epimerase